MGTSTEWQLAATAAARYHEILSPVILGPFARALVDRVRLQRQERVVDVGCGTGDGARYAAESVGPSGKVTAVDLNAGMIDVARNVPALHGATIEWRIANATALPLEDGRADAVLCAQTLQFLPNKKSALLEMRRVLAPAGRIGVSLWTAIDDNPYFAALVGALTRHLGADTAAGLRSAFALTAADDIRTLLTAAGFVPVNLFETQLSLPLPDSIRFVPRHLSATPMAADYGAASTAQQAAIAQDVAGEMKRYVTDGRLSVPFTSHLRPI